MIIHSFDDVLRAKKEIHSFELSPGGRKVGLWRPLPWIGIGYWVVIEIAFYVASRLPILDLPYEVVSWAFNSTVYWAIPLALVWLMMRVEFEGLSPHRWIGAFALYLARPKRTLAGLRVQPEAKTLSYSGKIDFWHDVFSPRLHRGWVIGGRMTTSVPVRFTHALRHRHQVIRSGGYTARDHEVEGRLEVRP